MVDALREIRMVLAEGGMLVDLRPMSAQFPIEAVTGESVFHLGVVDATGMALDDSAADAAIAETVRRGWFVLRRRMEFDFELYWETIDEMSSYVEEKKRMKGLTPPPGELEKAYRDFTVGRPGMARLRCRRGTLLAVYEKTGR